MVSASDLLVSGLEVFADYDILTTVSTVTVTRVYSSTMYLNAIQTEIPTATAARTAIFDKRSNNFFDNYTSNSSSMSNTSMIVAIVVPISVVAIGIAALLIWRLFYDKRKIKNFTIYPSQKYGPRFIADDTRIEGTPGESEIFDENSDAKSDDNGIDEFKLVETKRFGPVDYNWVSTPASAIKSFFNRKSVYGLEQATDRDLPEDISTTKSLPFTDTVTGDLASPFYANLKPFKLLNHRSQTKRNVNESIATQFDSETKLLYEKDDEYESQVLTKSRYTPRQIPILADVPAASKSIKLIQVVNSSDNTPENRGISQNRSTIKVPITPRVASKTPATPTVNLEGGKWKRCRVIRKYDKNMDDELSIDVGELIWVVQQFSDGWCMVKKSTISPFAESGVVPRLCIAPFHT